LPSLIYFQEYDYFLSSEERLRKKKLVTFYCQKTEKYLDSVARGALNSPWGARIALPFYAQFETFNEAYDYCPEISGSARSDKP
uniref:COesterase domain-containing protein n=1 Tax=Gongylonema pulchrum TaxID=637853 RepID=A0A183ET67_9BILA